MPVGAGKGGKGADGKERERERLDSVSPYQGAAEYMLARRAGPEIGWPPL